VTLSLTVHTAQKYCVRSVKNNVMLNSIHANDRRLEDVLPYEISDIFALKLKVFPIKIGIDIANQIDYASMYLPMTDGFTEKAGGVCTILDKPFYFQVEYIYQPEEMVCYLDIDIIEVDDYLDYILENKTLKSNNETATKAHDKNNDRH